MGSDRTEKREGSFSSHGSRASFRMTEILLCGVGEEVVV